MVAGTRDVRDNGLPLVNNHAISLIIDKQKAAQSLSKIIIIIIYLVWLEQ